MTDFIGVLAIPKNVGATSIADLYLKEKLTASQIAARIGLSKPAVLNRLHKLGIRRETLKGMAEEFARPAVRAPFGQRVVDGVIVEDRRELKVARYIVELRARQGLPWNEVVRRLNDDCLRTRTGLPWKIGTAKMVFDRWSGKV